MQLLVLLPRPVEAYRFDCSFYTLRQFTLRNYHWLFDRVMHEGRRYRSELRHLQSDNQVCLRLVCLLFFLHARFDRSTLAICIGLLSVVMYLSRQRRSGVRVSAI